MLTANLSSGCSGIQCPSWSSHLIPALLPHTMTLLGELLRRGLREATILQQTSCSHFSHSSYDNKTPEPGSFAKDGNVLAIDLKAGSPRSKTGFIVLLFHQSGQEEESKRLSLNSSFSHGPTFPYISLLMRAEPSWTTHLFKVLPLNVRVALYFQH